MTKLDSLLQDICQECAELLGVRASSIFFKQGDYFIMRAACGYPANLVGRAIYAPGEGITGAELYLHLARALQVGLVKAIQSWSTHWRKLGVIPNG